MTALLRAIEMLKLGKSGKPLSFQNDEIDALLATLSPLGEPTEANVAAALNATHDDIPESVQAVLIRGLSAMGLAQPTLGAWQLMWAALIAARTLPLQDHGWQDISTAPKDGDQVLLWSEAWEMSWGIQIGSFGEGKWHCGEGSVAEGEMEFDDDDPYPIGPTHWRPLPHRPMVAEQQTEKQP